MLFTDDASYALVTSFIFIAEVFFILPLIAFIIGSHNRLFIFPSPRSVLSALIGFLFHIWQCP